MANAYTDPSKFSFANPLNSQQQQFNQTIGLGGQNNVNKAWTDFLMGPNSSPNASLQVEQQWKPQFDDASTNPDVLHNIFSTYMPGGNNTLGNGYTPIQQNQRDVLAQTRGTRPDYASTPLTQVYGNNQSSGTTTLANAANPTLGAPPPGTPSMPSAPPPNYSNYITNPSAYLNPSMDFTMKQGMNALQNSAAAQGNLLSGQTLKGIEDYAQGLAGTNWQNAFNNAQNDANRLYGIDNNDRNFAYNAAVGDRNFNAGIDQNLAQMGLNGTSGSSTLASQLAAILSGNAAATGQALGTGTMGANNSLTSAINSIIQQMSGNQALSSLGGLLNGVGG